MDVFVYYWKTEEITEKNNYHTELRIYGVDTDNENVCIRVQDCKSELILEFENNEYLLKNFETIKSKLSKHIYNKSDINTIKIVNKRKLYGCHLDDKGCYKKFPFLQIYFSSNVARLSILNKIKTGKIDFNNKVLVHEKQASTELQLIVDRDISASGWITVKKAVDTQFKTTRCNKEYIVSKNQLYPSESRNLADIKFLAWDIEAKCKNISKFPGKDSDDCVFQISAVLSTTLSNKLEKYLLTLGDCNQFAEDVTIIKFESERSLIIGFADLIKKIQPNILTGWNIFKFDIEFLIARAKSNMCLGEFLCFGYTDEPSEIKNVKWSSKAFSTTDVQYIDAEGVLSIDLIEIVRKDYKLDSYSLNNVSKHFLKEQKDDMTFKQLMKCYNSYLNNLDTLADDFARVGKYCVQDSMLVIDLFKKLQVFLSLSEMSKTTSTSIISVHLQGQQKKFYSQVYRYCKNEGIIVESDVYKSKDSDKYTGAYVFDPKPGLYDYVVPLDFASLYPSIIIAYNLDYTTLIQEDTIIDESKVTTMEWEDHIGCSHDPIVQKLLELDNLIKLNKNTSQLKKERAVLTKKLSSNKMCQKRHFKFFKESKGVLPTIIQKLLDARKKVRQQMKDPANKGILEILNQRQLSYKISANSMYGATGVKSGTLPCMPIAMCVTYTGRKSIQTASNILKSLGGTIVYGDTDSNYVTFNDIKGSHEQKCSEIWDKSLKVAQEISDKFPNPMKIEFEEVIYYKFMILTKKRYMYYSCDKKGLISSRIGQKGVLLARRDTSKFVKNIYEQTVVEIFDKQTKTFVLNSIAQQILQLMTLQLNDSDLVITKAVNDYNDCNVVYNEEKDQFTMGNYKVPKPKPGMSDNEKLNFMKSRLPAQVQLEIRMVDRGDEKPEGARIEYIMTKKHNCSKQCDKIEQYQYFVNNKEMLSLDRLYYVKKLIDPLEQMFDSVYYTDKAVENMIQQFILKDKAMTELRNLFAPVFIFEMQ